MPGTRWLPHFHLSINIQLENYIDTRRIINVVSTEFGLTEKELQSSSAWRQFFTSIDYLFFLSIPRDCGYLIGDCVNNINQKIRYRFNGQYSWSHQSLGG